MPTGHEVEQAREAVRQGRWQDAITSLEAWIETYDDDRLAHELLALCHAKLGDWRQALAPAQRAAELGPDRASAWCNLGTILRNLGRSGEAEKALRQALVIDPSFARAEAELRQVRQEWDGQFCGVCEKVVNPVDAKECPGCGGLLHAACLERGGYCLRCTYGSGAAPPAVAVASPKSSKQSSPRVWLVPVLVIATAVIGGSLGLSVLCRSFSTPGKFGWRKMQEGVAKHAKSDYAAAISLYREATSQAPGLAAAYLAWAWAELRVNPFDKAAASLTYSGTAQGDLAAVFEELAQQAKWSQTDRLDRVDQAAEAALAALQQKGPGYKEQVAAGLGPEQTAALAYAILAASSAVRAAGAIYAFADQLDQAINAPGILSQNLSALRQSTVLRDAIGWCERARQMAAQADAVAPDLRLGEDMIVAARELSRFALSLSCLVAGIEDQARAVEDLAKMLGEMDNVFGW